MPEYCITFVSGPDDDDNAPGANELFHVHVEAPHDIAALALAYQAASEANVALTGLQGVVSTTMLPVPAAAVQLYEELRAMHHNGAPAATWAPPGGPGAPLH